MTSRQFLMQLISISCLASASTMAQEPVDLILRNGKIVTVDRNFSIAQAIAIRDGRIAGLGSDAAVLALGNETTRVVDLGGKMLLPGLIDSHTHPAEAAMFEFDHPVPDMESIEDVLAYVSERTRGVPPGEWIWVNQVFITRLREQRYPTRDELDQVAPQHPVVFSTGPDAMANSLALQLSGIDKDFKVTGTGEIERDRATGEPTGMLRGNTKRFLKGKSQGKTATPQDRLERLQLLLRDYNAVGLTAIADRAADDPDMQLFQRLRNDNRLTIRAAFSFHIDAQQNLETVQAAIRKVAEHPLRQAGDDRLRIVGIKTFLDGGMLTGSAYMREPWGVSQIYSIADPQYRGHQFIESENLLKMVRTTVEHGLQFTAHSVGDGAVHALIEAYERINETTPIRGTRPCITHCNFMSREAVDRMAKIGAVCDIQPAWLYLDSRTLQAQFGYERLRYFQPLRSLMEAGVMVGGGSDHMQKIGSFRSINPYNPFLGMSTAVTRKAKWYDGQLHPEEALSREQAIRFYTINNAYLLFLEDQIGSLEIGKQADMIVIDRDLLTCEAESIRDTKVIQTYLAGKVVYE